MLPPDDVRLRNFAAKVIARARPPALAEQDRARWPHLSCHTVTRAFLRAFSSRYPGLRGASGFLRPNYEHSWLVTKNGNALDLYPPGTLGGPLLIWGPVAKDLYEENEAALLSEHKPETWEDAIRLTATSLTNAAARLS